VHSVAILPEEGRLVGVRERRHVLPVLTASNFADEQALCMRVGASRLMMKPFQIRDLEAAIAALCPSPAIKTSTSTSRRL